MGGFQELFENTWALEDGGVRVYLLAGTERALVIDTGMTHPDVVGEAKKVTDLPLMLVNTHADPDHISANDQFECCYMHPAEFVVYRNIQKRDGKIIPVFEEDVFELGERDVEVIYVPGHTPGSITLYDQKNRCLFGGDPIQEDGNIYMFGIHRDLKAYIEGLDHLLEREWDFDRIYPSHAKLCVGKEIIPALIEGAEDILEGKIEGKPGEAHGNPITIYDIGIDRFLCESEK